MGSTLSASSAIALPPVLSALRAELGPDILLLADDLHQRSINDASGYSDPQIPLALLRPRSTEEVSRALRLCTHYGQSVVPQGGLTGLVGAANPCAGDIALSLERMNRIEAIDPVAATITVEAGVPLQRVQEAAEAAGFYFPLDFGARGSCTIGGTMATNAGGNRVIRYGMMRDQVLSLEAVRIDGTVIGQLNAMIKNNTGYDLRHLLIGSEGTLAVITRAVLRLRPAPRSVATAWCALPSFAAVTELLCAARAGLADGPSAFEVMWANYYDTVLARLPHLRAPLEGHSPFHVLLESVGQERSTHQAEFSALLERLLEKGIITDAVIAHSEADTQALWAIRDAPAAFSRFLSSFKAAYDISFGIAQVGEAAAHCESRLRARIPHAMVLIFGHLGDGNIHLVVDVPGGQLDAARLAEIDALIYGVVGEFHGSISAEHGIGLRKKNHLTHSRSAEELATMRAIKAAFDPHGLLNPGKIF